MGFGFVEPGGAGYVEVDPGGIAGEFFDEVSGGARDPVISLQFYEIISAAGLGVIPVTAEQGGSAHEV